MKAKNSSMQYFSFADELKENYVVPTYRFANNRKLKISSFTFTVLLSRTHRDKLYIIDNTSRLMQFASVDDSAK